MSFFAPDPPKPADPIPPPTLEDPAVEEARRKELAAARKARGRATSLLTGGQGVEGAAPTERTTLLGR